MDVVSIRGLKYPDVFITRFFFKNGHNARSGHVVELGCGNGNNLMLYHTFGWSVTGVDISAEDVDDARHNLGSNANLIVHDLSNGLPTAISAPIDVLLLPYSLCYIPRQAFRRCLQQLAPLLAGKADVFLSLRTPDDYRFGRGRLVEPNGFILHTAETGENGLLNVFYHDHEIVELLATDLGLPKDNMTILHCHFDNIQNNRLIPGNSDLIVWGQRHTPS